MKKIENMWEIVILVTNWFVTNVQLKHLTHGYIHKWVDQFGCHISYFYLVVVIVMPMLFYKFWNVLKWTWFKDFNLNIYMMHNIIL
jgi:hypothetical protein